MRRRVGRQGVVVVGAGAVLIGCAGSTPSAAPAEVVDAVDCAVREVLWGPGAGEELPPAPPAGAVPGDFTPVAAVQCRPVVRVQPAPRPTRLPGVEEQEPAPELLPDGGRPDPADEPGPDADPTAAPIEAVRLEGDLRPLLRQLARPDVQEKPGQACMAMREVVPVVYLVDASDRAIRVRWPAGPCGFRLDGADESLAGLKEVERVPVLLP